MGGTIDLTDVHKTVKEYELLPTNLGKVANLDMYNIPFRYDSAISLLGIYSQKNYILRYSKDRYKDVPSSLIHICES